MIRQIFISINRKNFRWLSLAIVSCIFLMHGFAYSQNIATSKHNLSATGPGQVKSSTESEICIFCHTPHNSSAQAPLWNRNNSTATYILYNQSVSSTLNASPGQPNGASVLCLSCHDGTIALGSVLSKTTDIFNGAGGKMPASSNSNLGTNLSDDHPISFLYNSSLATADMNLKFPPEFPAHVDHNSEMQCTSCHDPHNNQYSDFLLTTEEFGALCLKCHNNTYWAASTHKSSPATWNGTGSNPWINVKNAYTSVSQNACANCHRPHKAAGNARLLKSNLEENNCLDCHNGNTAAKNIAAEFNKAYRHNVAGYNGIHNPTEASPGNKHVECADCHNPHASNNTTANAPNANGPIRGVKGINQSGVAVNPINYEYELCYRCHSVNPVTTGKTARQITQDNTRLEFDLANPSYHPVAGSTKNTSSPSLISPLTVSSKIYCTDCHASNGTAAPAGPHGSIYPSILKLNNVTTDNTSESASNYALCYSCHSRTNILGNNSFKEHNKHIAGERTPCNVCHDPHGISSLQGTATRNTHLINFDTNIVKASSSGLLYFEDLGNRRGRCYLTCHGENHNPLSY